MDTKFKNKRSMHGTVKPVWQSIMKIGRGCSMHGTTNSELETIMRNRVAAFHAWNGTRSQ